MNKLPAISIPVKSSSNLTREPKKPVERGVRPDAYRERPRTASSRTRQSGKLHSRIAGFMAFVAAVFVSMIAAVTVASHDDPLMLGGF
ncbi:hypothetical protein [Polaromonas sp. CG_9.11]|uniref:hypothetical protein n=1 Tax=Polaromonas sp. CG_9.11 TaxID=2787730 RepID=UPI0018C94494|nr:hypothetical protein [Polaromonas sp. CG_9.11]MBG6074325.1 hypothetical protein [Polaromonas sp. CG_9.11]